MYADLSYVNIDLSDILSNIFFSLPDKKSQWNVHPKWQEMKAFRMTLVIQCSFKAIDSVWNSHLRAGARCMIHWSKPVVRSVYVWPSYDILICVSSMICSCVNVVWCVPLPPLYDIHMCTLYDIIICVNCMSCRLHDTCMFIYRYTLYDIFICDRYMIW